MQYTILLFTVLFALSQSLDIDFGVSLEVDLSVEIGATLNENLNIGTSLTAILNSVATISSDLTVSGTLTVGNLLNSPLLRIGANTTVIVDELVLTAGQIEMGEGSTLRISGDASLNSDTTIAGRLVVDGTVDVGADVAIFIDGSATLEDVSVAADATLEFSEDSVGILFGSISLSAGAVLECAGTVSVDGDVSGSGDVVFSSETSIVSSFLNSANVEGDVVLMASSSVYFGASATTTLSSDLIVGGSARFNIESDTSVTVEGSASFESGSSYSITITSEDSEDILTVEGEVALDGALVIDSDVDISVDSEIAIMYYGSRAEGSVFASVSVTSAKRALSADEYEVDYQEGKAVIRASAGDTDSSVVLTLGSAALLLAFF